MFAPAPAAVRILHKDLFLPRDEELTRGEIDAGQGRVGKKPFWQMVADTFNSENPELGTIIGSDAEIERYESLGFSSRWSGYVCTAENAEDVFKNLRTEGMSIMAKFRSSGMGNCGTRIRELSEMHALTVLSSNYMDFCK